MKTAAPRFIASKMHAGGRLATLVVALSFFVTLVSFAVAAGFRKEIRNGISELHGDVILSPAGYDWFALGDPLDRNAEIVGKIAALEGVESMDPVVTRGGIVRSDGIIQGVLVKGVADSSLSSMHVRIPAVLGSSLKLHPGDRMTTWFVGDEVRVRRFTIDAIYDSIDAGNDNYMVIAPIQDLQRLNGWGADSVSAFEMRLSERWRTREGMADMAAEAGTLAFASEEVLFCQSIQERFSQIFDWLDLIDFNVFAILLLMTVVAGFNMISALLIIMFRNISTIGALKALGMGNRGISAVFLRLASSIVLKGMAAGGGAALLFCLLQGSFRFLHLNPANYYLSFVPVSVDAVALILACVFTYAAIMLFTLLPCLFISSVDPARTLRQD